MKKIIISAALLSACSAPQATDPASVKQEVNASLAAFANAVNEGDVETAAAFYHEGQDFYWVERGQLQYDNAGAAKTSLLSLADNGFDADVKYIDSHISVLGPDAAIASMRFETTFTHQDGRTFSFGGWQTTGMTRTSEGWKISGGHTEEVKPTD